jgi:hypothetical protein
MDPVKFAEQLELFDAVKKAFVNLESVSKRASAEYAKIQSAKSERERKGAGRIYNQIQMEHDEAMQAFLAATNALRKSWKRIVINARNVQLSPLRVV